MINVKDQVYTSLRIVTENVTDYYPRDWEKDLAIQYMEEENNVVEFTDMEEQKAYCRYRIDIWAQRSTSEAAVAVECRAVQSWVGEDAVHGRGRPKRPEA